jgi:carbamoyl-phosphate synthase large subunit
MVENVLVPGAGGPAAINTVKALKMVNFKGRIVSTDSNPLSAGFYLSDKYYIVPEAKDEKFFPQARKIILDEKIDTILPTSGFDIYPYSEHKKELQELGTNVVISDSDTLNICRDKWLTFQTLKEFDVAFTTLDPNEIKFPCMAKPRFGKGAKNIFLCKNKTDLEYVTANFNDTMFQEYLPGEEYTIDVLSDLQGKSLIAVPRIRLETRGGVSTKGKIVLNKDIQEVCMKIAEFIKIIGPSCMQGILDSSAKFKLFEINPRLGGGTMFTTLAGANFPKMIIDMVEGKPIHIPKIKEITVIRYFKEIVVPLDLSLSYSIQNLKQI